MTAEEQRVLEEHLEENWEKGFGSHVFYKELKKDVINAPA